MRFRLLINRGLLPVKFQCVRFMQSVKIPVIFWWSIGSVNIRANRRKSVSSDSVLIEWMRNSAVLRRPPTEQNRIYLTFLHQCRRKVSLKILYLSFCKFFFFTIMEFVRLLFEEHVKMDFYLFLSAKILRVIF